MESLLLDLPQCLGSTRLRSLKPSDLPQFAQYRSDPVLAEYQGWDPMNHDSAKSFLAETVGATHLINGEWIQLAIAHVESDELAGDLGIFLSQDATYAELGFTLARPAQGKGHATRAAELAVQQVFRHSRVLEIRAVTDQLNRASVAVLKRTGFAQRNTRNVVFKGKVSSELVFARSRSEA